MRPSFAEKLGFRIYQTNMNVQKLNGSRLDSDKMIIGLFQVNDKDKKSHFFKKTFLLPNTNMDILFQLLFLILSKIKMNFNNEALR